MGLDFQSQHTSSSTVLSKVAMLNCLKVINNNYLTVLFITATIYKSYNI